MDTLKLEKIREAIRLAQQGITKEEFTKSFKLLMDLVLKVESNLIDNINRRTSEANEKLNNLYEPSEQRLSELENIYKETIKQIEEDSKSTVSNLKRWALEKVGSLFIENDINRKLNERLEEVDDKLSEIRSFTFPELPAPPDTSVIALEASKMALDEVLPLIPPKIDLETELPKLGEPIRDALELLQGDDRLDKSAIKGLQEELDRIIKIAQTPQIIGGGGVGKQNMYYYDLTPYLDGVTSTFSLPAFTRILKIETFSAAVLRPNTDWTADPNARTITFTSQIDPAVYLQSGQTTIVYYAI